MVSSTLSSHRRKLAWHGIRRELCPRSRCRVAQSGNALSFSYDAAGRRSSTGVAGGVSSFGYEALSRLSSLAHDLGGTGADQSFGFAYNPASQIVSRSSGNDAYSFNGNYDVNRGYTVNGLSQYTAAGPATFAYDANGNLTLDGSTSFLYDAETAWSQRQVANQRGSLTIRSEGCFKRPAEAQHDPVPC